MNLRHTDRFCSGTCSCPFKQRFPFIYPTSAVQADAVALGGSRPRQDLSTLKTSPPSTSDMNTRKAKLPFGVKEAGMLMGGRGLLLQRTMARFMKGCFDLHSDSATKEGVNVTSPFSPVVPHRTPPSPFWLPFTHLSLFLL